MELKNIGNLSELLKLEQTLFALPFAYTGMLLAGRGFPSFRVFLFITLAMAAARTAGMSLNRVIDKNLDAQNPRTKNRALPQGLIKPYIMILLAAASLSLLFYSAYSLNRLTFYLSPIAALLLIAYSYFKRFSYLCHFVLGIIEFCAPVGAWIAVTGTLSLPAVFLGISILLWITGIDIIYAIQDYEPDRVNGIFSIPVKIGIKNALCLARAIHIMSAAFLVLTMIKLGLGIFFLIGIIIYSSLLFYQHYLVRSGEPSSIGKSFFSVNAYTSSALFLFTVMEVIYG